MGKVNVTINGYGYDVACEDGQEDRLKTLSDYVNKRVGELQASVGSVGEARLLVMAAILIADETLDAFARIDELTAALAAKDSEALAAQEQIKTRLEAKNQDMAAAMIDGLAERMETIAERLEQA